VDLYMPGLPEVPFKQLSKYRDVFNIKVIEQLPRRETVSGPVFGAVVGQDPGRIRFSFQKTEHPLLTYALVAEGDGRLFYSADTKWSGTLPGFAAGVDVALCEASVVEEDREYTSVGHLTAGQAGKLARQAGAGQLVITHFWPEYDLETLAREAKAGFGRPVTLAREGLQINVGSTEQ
jgi:ribonuclease BN (tRNA processing enzyme)